MKNPTVEQAERIIRNLKKIEKAANNEYSFSIAVAAVHSYGHKCGTVHCVAGWYAVSQRRTKYIKNLIDEGYCSFKHGAHLMAKHLGFTGRTQLEEWMCKHPEIWGNRYGDVMFYQEYAYKGLKENSNRPMSIVIQHWEKVRDRLRLIEERQEDLL